MKKTTLFFLTLLYITSIGNAQTVTLTYTGRQGNGEWVQLDSVKASNLTRGWTTTITWPDTVIEWTYGVGIADYADDNRMMLQLSQNTPNPFNGTTEVDLLVSEQGTVTLEMTDVNGRMVISPVAATYSSPLQGTNKFRIQVADAGVYFLTARQNGHTSSIKMINNGTGASNNIEFVGKLTSTPTMPSAKDNARGNVNGMPFALGDQMDYAGYATINQQKSESQHIIQQQGASQTFVLLFSEIQDPVPTVITSPITNITKTSATVGGNITEDGGNAVFDRGICYNASGNPTISDNCIHFGSGLGSFSSELENLMNSSVYYVRAYAINSVGVGYGEEQSFITLGNRCPGTPTVTDYDGNVYNTVQIGSQCWMQTNLRSTKYANGEDIPDFVHSEIGMEDPAKDTLYGYLYNWGAAMHGAEGSATNPSGVQGICPDGWHLPSLDEFRQLVDYVSQNDEQCSDGAKALSAVARWHSSDTDCSPGKNPYINNASCFSAYPVGLSTFGEGTSFWATQHAAWNYACGMRINYKYAEVYINESADSAMGDDQGKSIRCLRD